MSGMDRLTELLSRASECFKHHGVAGGLAADIDEAILAHRRASQAAPAPSDGLREALEAIRDGYGPNHLSKFALAIASAALMTPAPAQEGGE